MPAAKSRHVSSRVSLAAFRDVVRRLDALERRVAVASTGRRPVVVASDSVSKLDILEEDSLRRAITRDETLARQHPDQWRKLESDRLRKNSEQSALNQRLRAEGLRPIEPELSLQQRKTKLRQLEARNRTAATTRRQPS